MFTLMIVLNSGYTHTIVAESDELLAKIMDDFWRHKNAAEGIQVHRYNTFNFVINMEQVAFMAIFENTKKESR